MSAWHNYCMSRCRYMSVNSDKLEKIYMVSPDQALTQPSEDSDPTTEQSVAEPTPGPSLEILVRNELTGEVASVCLPSMHEAEAQVQALILLFRSRGWRKATALRQGTNPA